ncbi:MAG: hypothetical protein ACKOA8_17560, partial [Deltaproteobacteria bacterium]
MKYLGLISESILKYGLILWVSCSIKVLGRIEPSSNQIAIAKHFASFFVSLESDKVPGFYGTGWIAGWSEKYRKVFVLVPAHVLPMPRKSFSILARWRPFSSSAMPLEILAEDPGNDLALASFSVNNFGSSAIQQIKNTVEEAEIFQERTPPIGSSLSTAVLGVPGYWATFDSQYPRLVFKGGEQNKMRQNIEDDESAGWLTPFDASTVAIGRPDFSTSTQWRSLNVCPPIFLENCFELVQSTQGFSGGVILVNLNQGGQPRGIQDVGILGMVTHFSPLTDFSYVIPAKNLFTSYRRMRRYSEQIQGYYIEKHERDENPYFEYLTEDSLKILRGSLAGKIIRRKGKTRIGGGWDSSKGGWDSSKGGGEFGSGLFKSDMYFNVAGAIFKDELFEALRHPNLWHLGDNSIRDLVSAISIFKGLENTLEYEPGVDVDHVRYFKWGKEPINELSDFTRQYALRPQESFSNNPETIPLPRSFIGMKSDIVSSVNLSSSHKFKEPLTLARMVKADPQSVLLSVLEGNLLKEQLNLSLAGKIAKDIFAVRSDHQQQIPVQPVRAEIVQGELTFNFVQTDSEGKTIAGSEGSVQMPYEFQPLGNGTYRYAG